MSPLLERVREWTRGPAVDERWIVVDVESSGLDPARDRLIAIGAVALRSGRVVPPDSFEVTLRQPIPSSTDNILVHGIGVEAQAAGCEPAEALERFVDYAQDSPILAFHAPFDRKLIERAIKEHLRRSFDSAWLDLAELAPALFPQARLKSLDEWLAFFGIRISDRHNAAADAFATALLAARLLERARRQQMTHFGDLRKLGRNARWAG